MNKTNKLLSIQSELNAPKDQLNSFGNYNYRSCESILTALKPLLVKHEVVLFLSDEMVQMGDRFYVKATARLIDGDLTTTATAFAREELIKKGMDSCQITGSASSYARKYALNGLFLIDDNKDSDHLNKGEAESIPAKPTYKTETKPKRDMPGMAPKEGQVKTATGLIIGRKDPNSGGFVAYAIEKFFKENGKPMYFSTNLKMDIETIDGYMKKGEAICMEYTENDNPNFAAHIKGIVSKEDVPF